MMSVFTSARKAAKTGALKRALENGSHAGALEAVDTVVPAMKKSLQRKLPGLLTAIMEAGGNAAAMNLNKQLGLRAAAPAVSIAGIKFDVTNPKAVDWVKGHATELIDDLTQTTREELQAAILDAFESQETVDTLASDILDIIGNAARAETIARTETMTAANAGQQALWDQAVDDNLLTGNELQVWIVTPDDLLCPICEPMDGVTAPLDGEFETEDDTIDGPPAHPNCRCTLGLELA